MNQSTFDLVLRLRDQATATWEKTKARMESGAKNMAANFKANWLAITAGAVAAGAAVRKAMDFAQIFADTVQLRTAFQNTMRSMGKDAEAEFAKIKRASAGLVSDKSLLEATNRAVALGIPIEKVAQLMQIARARAREMGTTTEQAFSDIATGVGRASPMILDNLGLTIKIGQANETYAKQIGKTVAELTDYEKKQAILNATIEAGSKSLEVHNLNVKTLAENIQTVKAQYENIEIFVGQMVARAGIVLVGLFNFTAGQLAAIAALFLIPLAEIEKGLNALGITSSTALQDASQNVQKFANESLTNFKNSFDLAFTSAEKFAEAMGGGSGGVGGAMKETDAIAREALPYQYRTIQDIANAWVDARGKLHFYSQGLTQELRTAALTADEQIQTVTVKTAVTIKEVLDKMDKEQQAKMQKFQASFRQYAQLASQAINMISGFSKNASAAEISRIEEQRDTRLQAIDAELAKEELTEEQRNLLLDRRKKLENDFQNQIRKAKEQQFKAEKQAAIIQSIIQTAIAVVEALPNLGLSIAVGILGAAQTAVIAGQPTPRFQHGTPPEGFTVPPGFENDRFPILVSSGERVDVTPAGEGRGSIVNLTININAPGTPKEMVKKAVEEGLRESGLTVDKYFISNRESRVFTA